LKQIKIVVGYKNPDGTKYEGLFPASLEELAKLKPEYEILPGWESDIAGVTDYDKLPSTCRAYVERVEELVGVPITWVGTGPERESMIIKQSKK
jgi:adenylosuccinate synthase